MTNTISQDLQRIPLAHAYRLLNHGPLVLLSTTDGSSPDVSTVAWSKPCRKNPPRFQLTVGTSHRTYKNLARTGVVGINIPTADLVELVLYCGRTSGNHVDKIAARSIELRPGEELTGLPLIASCAAWLECRVLPECLEAGTSDLTVEAVAATCRVGVLSPEYSWNVEAFPTLHHLGGTRFMVGERMITVE